MPDLEFNETLEVLTRNFNQNQFYPTPVELSNKVFQLVEQKLTINSRILDCSAGIGSLLEPFLNLMKSKINSNPGKNIFAIEIDLNLRYILQGKGYSVIGSDFMTFEEPYKFNVIVMNPPFKQGVDHVLRAWDTLEDEGELICILNKETIENPYSVKRKLLLSIIESCGYVIQMGRAFQDASRKTDVEIVIIKLNKPKSLGVKFAGFDPRSFARDETADSEFATSPLTKTDYIKSLCDRYKGAEKALIDRHNSQKLLDFYLEDIGYGIYPIDMVEKSNRESLRNNSRLEDQLSAIKLKFWEELFYRSDLTAKATSDFKARFIDFAKAQSNMAFNYRNCLEVLITVTGNRENILQDAIDSLFKIGCSFDKNNRIHWEGWTTNDAWRWNKKLIIPYAFGYNNSIGFHDMYGSYGDKCENFLDDLDKVFSIISGKPVLISSKNTYKTHLTELKYNSRYSVSYSSWFETTFLKFRIYKKGTIHIEILDKELLAEFNRRAAIGKPWMPEKSSYKAAHNKIKRLDSAKVTLT